MVKITLMKGANVIRYRWGDLTPIADDGQITTLNYLLPSRK